MAIIFTGGISGGGPIKMTVPTATFDGIPFVAARYWRLETIGDGGDGLGSGNAISELKMTYDSSSNLLNSFTLTSIGGAFDPSYPVTEINDGIAETSNATSIGFVSPANSPMDFYVDFGDGNDKYVSVYSIAPSGDIGSAVYNTVLGFNAYRSDNASDWTLVKTVTDITTGLGNWNPGTFRNFDITT